MAKLKVIGSSSKGNGYVLDCGSERLLIELGLPYREILKAADFKLHDIKGALVTHSHSDHCNNATILNCRRMGVRTYSTNDCAKKHNYVTAVQHKRKFQLGGFTIMPLLVPHSVECYAYVIHHELFGTLLFATDLTNFPYKVKCDHLMLECNYSEDVILQQLSNSAEIRSDSSNHLELNECIETIQRLNQGQIKNLILLHLSDSLSDEKMFYDKVYMATGLKPVFAAPDVEVELIKEEF